MKKLTLVLIACLMMGIISKAQFVNIPDSNFKKLLLGSYPACFNDSKLMDTTCKWILNEDSLYGSNDSIQDLTGIQYFKKLSYLKCDSNQLTSLPQLPNSLRYLYCNNNQLNTLPTLPVSLLSLNCEFNQLVSLPTLPKGLTNISCEENQMQALPILPDSLRVLICSFNQLKELPLLPPSLNTLDCGSNQLTTMPTLPATIQFFYCYGNQFKSMPTLPNKLSLLDCDNNMILKLPTLPDSLLSLECSYNQLASLPYKLPNSLNYLDVSATPISSLPAFDSLNQLQYLYCQGDSNLFCLPKLPNSLDSLNVSNTGVRCIPNNPGKDNIYPIGLPICNPTNNKNQCIAYPTIFGRVFYDNNSNGIKDSNELYIPYIPIKLSTGQTVLSNESGQYNITMTDTGSVSLTVNPTAFYRAVPNSIHLSFTSYEEQLSLSDIAIQPIGKFDTLGIHIFPWQNALLGKKLAYTVAYQNLGTINSFDTVSFTYDSTILRFDSASIPLLIKSGNTLKWQDTLSAHYFGNKYFSNKYQYPFFIFTVKPSAGLGTTLSCSATISSATTNAFTNDSIIIKGSFDPNSKDATPELTTSQVKNRDGIDYTIHFQNVGNAVANDVVIADTLSNLLNPSEFQIVGHNYFPSSIGFVNNIVYFQFQNINLIDSGSNQLMSNGFIHFKVQPQDTLSSGNFIHNKASIYFDYNDPVVTNTATTAIRNTTLPLTIISYQLSQMDGNVAAVQNNWTTANELNTKYFNIQRSADGTDFKTIGHILTKGNGGNVYQFIDNFPFDGINYYRLQIIDKDGRISFSKIISIQLSFHNAHFSIYPNPARDYIMLNGKSIKEVCIVDNVGRIVAKRILNVSNSQHRVDFNLAKGCYIVQMIMVDGKKINEKMVVE